MTTQHQARPAFVSRPIALVAAFGLALAVSAAFVAVRYDWRGSEEPQSPSGVFLAPSAGAPALTASEAFTIEMANLEVKWDEIFGPMKHDVTPYDEVAQALAQHDNAMDALLGQTRSFESSPGVTTPDLDELMRIALAEHEASIAPYVR